VVERRFYPLKLWINERWFEGVLIDPHYEKRHSDVMTDEIIMELVTRLNLGQFVPEAIGPTGIEYFSSEPLRIAEKNFRLVWLIEPGKPALGVINAFRTKVHYL
jgi:hypothetical protein